MIFVFVAEFPKSEGFFRLKIQYFSDSVQSEFKSVDGDKYFDVKISILTLQFLKSFVQVTVFWHDTRAYTILDAHTEIDFVVDDKGIENITLGKGIMMILDVGAAKGEFLGEKIILFDFLIFIQGKGGKVFQLFN